MLYTHKHGSYIVAHKYTGANIQELADFYSAYLNIDDQEKLFVISSSEVVPVGSYIRKIDNEIFIVNSKIFEHDWKQC